MTKLPSGTVTFLFTDIEGSTKLAQQYPESMPVLLARHHEILHQSIQAHDGYVFQVVGDSFAAAFHSANDALNAALDTQQLLQNEPWSPAPIKVRMGIHTGTAHLNDASAPTVYSGYATLASAQRIMSAGHGGQVLLSQTAHDLARGMLPEAVKLRDLGEHHLKDFAQAERIYQLVIPGLVNDFPSLKTLSAHSNNLPVQLSVFIGREKEIEQIKKRLEGYRLVTLTGSGGIGKTRLSIQIASELLHAYPNGVWLIELASITDPALVPQTACAALDVTPQGNTPALNVLTDYLRSKKILLIVDNCEHLIDACAQLAETLLQACPDLRIIASSREALGIDGENAYRVPSLSLADPHGGLKTIEQSEAVRLFVERANTVLPGYMLTDGNARTIAQICQRLDGIALAIVLAASRVKLFKVDQIAARLDDAFRLLTGGSRTALPRQQTLRGTIDWSYNLLTDEERRMLRRLSAFVGGWTLEAAEAIGVHESMLDLLIHLVDKSLVAVDREHGNEARYYLLETIRQYAREKLAESGEGGQVRGRHLDYFLKLAERAEPELYGAGQIEWSQKLENEHENLRAALEWSLQANVSAGQQLASALWWAWDYSGHLSEGYEWLKKMIAVSSEETILRAKLLSGAGWLAAMLGYVEPSIAFSEQSIALFRQLGDKESAAFPLATLATRSYSRADYRQATTFAEESRELFRTAGNKWGIRHALGILGYTADTQGTYEQAKKFYEESLLICKEIGDQEGSGWTLLCMGQSAEMQGYDERAMELYEEALQIEKAVKIKPVVSWILRNMAILCIRRGNYERGRVLLEEAIEIFQKMGDHMNLADSLQMLGLAARYQENYAQARFHYAKSLHLAHRMEDIGNIAECLIHIGQLLGTQGSHEKFARFLGMAEGAVSEVQKTLRRFFRIETEKFIETARSALGDEAYTAALESGKQTSLEEAIAFARKELQQ